MPEWLELTELSTGRFVYVQVSQIAYFRELRQCENQETGRKGSVLYFLYSTGGQVRVKETCDEIRNLLRS